MVDNLVGGYMERVWGWNDYGYQSYVPNPEDYEGDDARQQREELEWSRADDDYDAAQAEIADEESE